MQSALPRRAWRCLKKRLQFPLNVQDINFAVVPCIDPAITAYKKAYGQPENPSIALCKVGVADDNRIVQIELAGKIENRFCIIVERNADNP